MTSRDDMPCCRTCRWWEPEAPLSREPDDPPGEPLFQMGACTLFGIPLVDEPDGGIVEQTHREESKGAAAVIVLFDDDPDRATFKTEARFGCTEWKAPDHA